MINVVISGTDRVRTYNKCTTCTSVWEWKNPIFEIHDVPLGKLEIVDNDMTETIHATTALLVIKNMLVVHRIFMYKNTTNQVCVSVTNCPLMKYEHIHVKGYRHKATVINKDRSFMHYYSKI